MSASIFLIYKLTNYLGFQLKYKSLFLCAFMAFAVNIAAISMSPYLTRTHYVRLVLLVIVAAVVVTIYNEYLVRRDRVPSTAAGTPPIDEAPALPEEPEAKKKNRGSISRSSTFRRFTFPAFTFQRLTSPPFTVRTFTCQRRISQIFASQAFTSRHCAVPLQGCSPPLWSG